jgi:hypothetical protein
VSSRGCTVPDSQDSFESMSDVETLVRSAQHYVHVSRDLRPRVLETARALRAEERASRQIWQAAILVVLLGMLTMSARPRSESLLIAPPTATADSHDYSSPPGTSARYGDFNWGTVESFMEMRRRQAELLRLAL